MKRFRHYQKDTAIILTCFGSLVAQPRYQSLLEQVRTAFPDYPAEIAISSRMVLKGLAKQGQHYLNLPQQLANMDMAGYRRIIVASTYLFPTEEHAMAHATVDGFKQFSLSRLVVTPALLQQVKAANNILQALASHFPTAPDTANLFISHGAPCLDNPGYSAVQYAEGLLNRIGPRNFTCSLEGIYPFGVVREALLSEIRAAMPAVECPRVRLIPLLLVSGNHCIKDLTDISQSLGSECNVEMAKPISGERFCLLDLPAVTQSLIKQINDEIRKLG